MINVTVNEKKHELKEGVSLASLLDGLGLKPPGIAVAVGEEVIPRESWANTLLSDGMDILVIHAVSGG
ncbi:MAG: sulfur carrier protein ThiS [Bacteroidales bacterium]|jgi:sulfur carrier protein|nr:sulfur carrier protein ThiS [Bacteroidales bacterium]